jgi:hypothetical protein
LRYTIKNPNYFSHIGLSKLLPANYKAKETSLVSCEHNRKTKRCYAHLLFFLGAHAFQGDGPNMVYCHALATWDEPSPKERKNDMGFQTGTISHTKVTRLERNALLGKGVDLNSLTWLLVTCVFFQMYTTPALIQSTCSSGNATTWHLDQVHLPIFNTLHCTLSVWKEEVPCNLTQVVSDTFGGTSTFKETITTFYESAQLDSGETQYTKFFKHTFQLHSMCFQLPFHYGEPCHQEGKILGHKLVN